MAIAIETSADKARAWLYSALVHAACIALMFTSLWWTRKAVVITPPGPVIEAVLIGPAQAPKPRATKPRKADQPKPTPPKEEVKPEEQTEPVKPDTREQERIAALATEKAEAEKKEQEERQRQKQVVLEEQKKKDEADKKKKLEEEKQKQLKDKQAKELEDKQKKLEKQRLDELLKEEAEAKTGAEGKDDSLLAQYSAALLNAAFQNWIRPDTTESVVCDVNIKQIPGGEVLSANVVEPCRTDALTKQSIEAAILRAQPLPYKGFESVFRREIIFTFCFPKEACPQ
jgi:colicin import membrane protein